MATRPIEWDTAPAVAQQSAAPEILPPEPAVSTAVTVHNLFEIVGLAENPASRARVNIAAVRLASIEFENAAKAFVNDLRAATVQVQNLHADLKAEAK